MGSGGKHAGVICRGGNGTAARSAAAHREGGENPGSNPRLDDRQQPVIPTLSAPVCLNDVRAVAWLPARSKHPLGAGEDVWFAAGIGGAGTAGNPLCFRRHPNRERQCRVITASHNADGCRSQVHPQRVAGFTAFAAGIIPAGGVGGIAGALVGACNCRVGPLGTHANACHHRPLPLPVGSPEIQRTGVRQAPVDLPLRRDGLQRETEEPGNGQGLRQAQPGDSRYGGNLQGGFQAALFHVHRIIDEKGLPCKIILLQNGDQPCPGRIRSLLQQCNYGIPTAEPIEGMNSG